MSIAWLLDLMSGGVGKRVVEIVMMVAALLAAGVTLKHCGRQEARTEAKIEAKVQGAETRARTAEADARIASEVVKIQDKTQAQKAAIEREAADVQNQIDAAEGDPALERLRVWRDGIARMRELAADHRRAGRSENPGELSGSVPAAPAS